VLKLGVADCLLVSINVATGVSLVNIRLLPSSTSDNMNPMFAQVLYPGGREVNLNLRDLALVPAMSPYRQHQSNAPVLSRWM